MLPSDSPIEAREAYLQKLKKFGVDVDMNDPLQNTSKSKLI